MVFNDQFWLFTPSIATTNKLRTFVTNFRNLDNHFKNKTHAQTHTRALHNNKKSPEPNWTVTNEWETMNFTYGHLDYKHISLYRCVCVRFYNNYIIENLLGLFILSLAVLIDFDLILAYTFGNCVTEVVLKSRSIRWYKLLIKNIWNEAIKWASPRTHTLTSRL